MPKERTEAEMEAVRKRLEKEERQYIEQHGPRFNYNETIIRVQGEDEWKRRNHLEDYNISTQRMYELSQWLTLEDGQMDALIGLLPIDKEHETNPSDELLISLKYESRTHSNAPNNPIEWRFIREVIRPAKKDKLRDLFEIRVKTQTARAELARAVLRGESIDYIEVKLADLHSLMNGQQHIMDRIDEVNINTIDLAQGQEELLVARTPGPGEKKKGRTPIKNKAIADIEVKRWRKFENSEDGQLLTVHERKREYIKKWHYLTDKDKILISLHIKRLNTMINTVDHRGARTK